MSAYREPLREDSKVKDIDEMIKSSFANVSKFPSFVDVIWFVRHERLVLQKGLCLAFPACPVIESPRCAKNHWKPEEGDAP